MLPGSIWFGSARELRRDRLGAAERAFAAHGDVVRVQAGPPGLRRELYLMFHPDAAHRVLASNVANYRKDNRFYTEIRAMFGDGLLTSQDELWLRQKRFLQPLFTPRRVAGYAAIMASAVHEQIHRWRSRGSMTVDLAEEVAQLTLRVVCRVLFGHDTDDAIAVVRRNFSPLGETVARRAGALVRFPLTWPTPVNRRGVAAQRALHKVCDEIIARRRGRSSDEEDMITLLLGARVDGAALDASEIRDQILVFLLAGHETTATALTYALHLLGRHPDIQRKVRDEADTVVGAGTPTVEHAEALDYTTRVLKEAMRLYPPAPLIGRRAVEDDQICGYHIPGGSDLVLAPWVIHRHPQFWRDPARFDPSRFTAEEEKSRHRYAWMPFGGGPRACIGQHFSMLESVIALAALVRDFDFTAPPDEPRYTSHITLRTTHGVQSSIAPRR